jgi:hypothetical protein
MKTLTDSGSNATPAREFVIELLALDLSTCGPCTRTADNLDAGIASVAAVLQEAGAAVRVEKHVVRSAADAERLRFTASPTIRVNGRDIAPDIREGACGDCGAACGCGGGVNCRVWEWQGQVYQEAPKALVVDALLRAYADPGRPPPAAVPFQIPENLRGFFAGVTGKAVGCCEAAPVAPACAC